MQTRVIGRPDFYGVTSHEMAPVLFQPPLGIGQSSVTSHKFVYAIYPHYGWASDNPPKNVTFQPEVKKSDGEADRVREPAHGTAVG